MKKIELSQEIWKEGNMYIAYCPELDIPACGESVEVAKKNLGEVILINIEEMKENGSLDLFLEERGFFINENIISNNRKIVDFQNIEMQIGVLQLPKIIPTNWETQVKIFEKYGCKYLRTKGDHMIFHYEGALRPVVIPKYKEIPITIIKNNMNVVKMDRDKYFDLLKATNQFLKFFIFLILPEVCNKFVM